MSNTITEGKDRELPPDRDGEIVRAPTPALVELKAEIQEAAAFKQAGQGEAMRARSSIESRTDLRLAATNEAMRADPQRTDNPLQIEQETARRWADLDASDLGRIRSRERLEGALEAIAGHVRLSPEYADELQKRSPKIASAARILNDGHAKAEQQLALQAAAAQRQASIDAANRTREALIDASALAAVAAARSKQTARVAEQLAASSDPNIEQLREAQQHLKKAPALDLRTTTGEDSEIAAQKARVIKRPVSEAELSEALLRRFVVSYEKRGLLDKGATEFAFRSGEEQGRVAFVDAGKALSTERDDRSTIRAMVEVATAKNWKEITVSGTDDFRRNAWLEASLAGLQVRGYEPRETDRRILAEQLAQRQQPINTMAANVDREPDPTASDKVRAPAAPSERVTFAGSHQKHVDGDALTPHEKTVIDASRAILNAKALGEQFTDAALRELESKLRGERVYIGELVDHGPARYKFDPDKDPSYYVTLRSKEGEQVIWGKELKDAMVDRRIGEKIVLQHVGKTDVVVKERAVDAEGRPSIREKPTQRNGWKAELLSRFSEKARAEAERAAKRPTVGVYDPKAPRPPVQDAAAKGRAVQPERSADVPQRAPRER